MKKMKKIVYSILNSIFIIASIGWLGIFLYFSSPY